MSTKLFTVNDIAFNRIKLRPLVIFEHVLRTRSIVHAASQLHLSQPAVTKAIHELESMLDTTLFERSKKGVEPTAAGLLLGQRVGRVLTELRYLTDEINSFNVGSTGHVVVGTLLSGSVALLPRAVIQLKMQEPKILLSIRVGTVDELFPALIKGEIDIVVGRIPSSQSPHYQPVSLEHLALYREKLCLVVSPDHELLSERELTLTDLVGYPWILPLPSAAMRSTVIDYFNRNNIQEPRNLVESVSVLTNLNIIANSNFIGCMATTVADKFVQMGQLKRLPFEEIGDYVDVGISLRRNDQLTPSCQKLIQCLKEAAIIL